MSKYLLCFILLVCFVTSCKKENENEFVKIISREEWGSVEVVDSSEHQELNYITLHHGGEIFEKDKDVISYLKNLQKWSINTKNWIDIPYHYMIDLDGKVYETRNIHIPGDTNTDYDPVNHILVNVMGNYEVQEVNEKQYQSIVKLIYYLYKKYDIPLSKIAGHKDYTDGTVCPGKNLYKYLQNGSLIKSIKKMEKEYK